MVMLRFAMRQRWVIVVLACCTLGSCVPLYQAVPKGFRPPNDVAEFDVNMRAPEGTSLLETRLIAERLATEIRTLPGVTHTLVTIGNDAQQSRNLANIFVDAGRPEGQGRRPVRRHGPDRKELIPRQRKDLRIDVSETAQFGSGQSTAVVQYTITGPDLNQLTRYTQLAVARLKKARGAVDVDSNLIVGNPEIKVAVDRERAGNLGVDVADVANALQLLVGGLKVSSYEEAGNDYDIRARADLVYRADADGISIMTVRSKTGQAVPLSTLVRLRETTGPTVINRYARQRQVTITSNVAPGIGTSIVSDRLVQIVDDLHMAPGYRALPGGMTKEQGRAIKGFLTAIALSAIFMYLILAAQFGSWLHPITIMLALAADRSPSRSCRCSCSTRSCPSSRCWGSSSCSAS